MGEYFKRAGDLNGGDKYFERAGDLEQKDKFFKPAGDLGTEESHFKQMGDLNGGDKYFERAGDLEKEKTVARTKREEYEEYLSTIVSGVRYPSEFGVIRNAGSVATTWEEFKKLVDEGYNIVKAEYINDNLVAFEFQSPVIGENKGRGR